MSGSKFRSKSPSILTAVARMPFAQRRRALVELCKRGFLTCTRGQPGDPDAIYALGWLPLDDPDSFPEEVRRRHKQNMQRLLGEHGHA